VEAGHATRAGGQHLAEYVNQRAVGGASGMPRVERIGTAPVKWIQHCIGRADGHCNPKGFELIFDRHYLAASSGPLSRDVGSGAHRNATWIESGIEPLLADLRADKEVLCEPACSSGPGGSEVPAATGACHSTVL